MALRSPKSAASPQQQQQRRQSEILTVASVGTDDGSTAMNDPEANKITASFRGFSLRDGRMLLCYICGRPHAVETITRHIEVCQRHLDVAIDALQRHPLCGLLAYPQAPAAPIPSPADPKESKMAYNTLAAKCYGGTVVPCRGCGGSFVLSSVMEHFATCKRDVQQVPNCPIHVRFPSYDKDPSLMRKQKRMP